MRQQFLKNDRRAEHQKRQTHGMNPFELREPFPSERPPERPSAARGHNKPADQQNQQMRGESRADRDQNEPHVLGHSAQIRLLPGLEHPQDQISDAKKNRQSNSERDAGEPYKKSRSNSPQSRLILRARM